MRTILLLASVLLAALSGQAQEKVINVLKTDGTSSRTRVADLTQISFLTREGGSQGLLVKTQDGETVAVLFETYPVVTVSDGKLIVKSVSAEIKEFEITDIAEILFGDTSEVTAISRHEGFACLLQDGGITLRDIPVGVEPCIYTISGRKLPTPPFADGVLQLNQATLGTGIFIVKVGSFSIKIIM